MVCEKPATTDKADSKQLRDNAQYFESANSIFSFISFLQNKQRTSAKAILPFPSKLLERNSLPVWQFSPVLLTWSSWTHAAKKNQCTSSIKDPYSISHIDSAHLHPIPFIPSKFILTVESRTQNWRESLPQKHPFSVSLNLANKRNS